MIHIKQIKAARALLGWTQEDLATASGVSLPTIRNMEAESHSPRTETLATIQNCIEAHGIEFLADEGVRLAKEKFRIDVWEGRDSIILLLEDIYKTLSPKGGEILLSGLSESQWQEDYADDLARHVAMRRDAGINHRLLIKQGDRDLRIAPENYRWVPEWLFAQNPYYVYADKLALITWGPPRKVVLIQNQSIAETFRRQFNFNWDNGTVVKV